MRRSSSTVTGKKPRNSCLACSNCCRQKHGSVICLEKLSDGIWQARQGVQLLKSDFVLLVLAIALFLKHCADLWSSEKSFV